MVQQELSWFHPQRAEQEQKSRTGGVRYIQMLTQKGLTFGCLTGAPSSVRSGLWGVRTLFDREIPSGFVGVATGTGFATFAGPAFNCFSRSFSSFAARLAASFDEISSNDACKCPVVIW